MDYYTEHTERIHISSPCVENCNLRGHSELELLLLTDGERGAIRATLGDSTCILDTYETLSEAQGAYTSYLHMLRSGDYKIKFSEGSLELRNVETEKTPKGGWTRTPLSPFMEGR